MAQKLARYIEMDEFKKILLAEKDRRYKLIYSLGMGSGLRLSEIVGPASNSNQDIKALTKEQIDLERHKIRILGKGGKERITVTSPWLTKNNVKLLPIQIPRRTVQGRFTRLCEKTLGRKLNFHTLRHGFGNFMVNVKGVPLPMVQQMLGHSRLDTTGIYTKSNPQAAIDTAWESF